MSDNKAPGSKPKEAAEVSLSVQALIERLRAEGIADGQGQAARIVADAERKARSILKGAEDQARTMVEAAGKEAVALKSAGHEALKIAARDTVLDLRGQMSDQFTKDVQRLVSEEMQDEGLLRQMILESVGRARDDAGLAAAHNLEVLLPRDAIGLEDLRRDPKELQDGTLTKFVLSLAHELLKKGVTFGLSPDDNKGIRIISRDDEVTLELTDKALARIILEHLQPRFRALLEGIVK